MKNFSYFLFENFDADLESENPGNPRRIINARADAILSRVADFSPQTCPATRLWDEFGTAAVNQLITAGVFREMDGQIAYDTPIFLAEDVPALKSFSAIAASPLADRLWELRDKLLDIVSEINNGFDPQRNLYHILCGMIFDGFFFDWLEQRDTVAVSRIHPSGLDYLSIIYEDCPELKQFSDGLLCSYNRLTDGEIALESFGDADGNRFDLYRCFRLREEGHLPEHFKQADELLNKLPKGKERQVLLDATRSLLQGNGCQSECLAILELFGYAKNGRICVPVFCQTDEPIIKRLASLIEKNLYDEAVHILREAQANLEITATKHGVPSGEIANELYHILFGSINEELVKRGLTAAPPYKSGEGRFLQCIEW
ncbi:MAG: hypothetical protein K2K21_16255 [Lachnospiraceae bacterium]|nr:hypothetical protein [Lachnospiraceae bacterium]